MAVVKFRPNPSNVVPNTADLQRIPLAKAGEYCLSEKEVKDLRRHIYSLNKSHVHGWRWRTLREGDLLMVWRVK